MRRQATPAWCARTVSAAWSWRWFRRFEPGGAYVEIKFRAPHAIDAPLPLRLLDFHTARWATRRESTERPRRSIVAPAGGDAASPPGDLGDMIRNDTFNNLAALCRRSSLPRKSPPQ